MAPSLNKGKGRAIFSPSPSNTNPTLFSSETLSTIKRKRTDDKQRGKLSQAEQLVKSREEALANCRPQSSKTHIPIRKLARKSGVGSSAARISSFSRRTIADSDSDSELLNLSTKRIKVNSFVEYFHYTNYCFCYRQNMLLLLSTTTRACLTQLLQNILPLPRIVLW